LLVSKGEGEKYGEEMGDAVTREIVERAREFRTTPTRSEALLWDALRDRQLTGVKFRRQSIIGPFVADFCAPLFHLVVEVDGAVHAGQREHDVERQQWLEAEGYRVLRVSADAVETDLPSVLRTITDALSLYHSPSPLLGAKERGPGGEVSYG
jgi:very-short-patch-repair endonuclease